MNSLDFTFLLEQLDYNEPLITVCETVDPERYSPITKPLPGRHACCFSYYREWLRGSSLVLSADNHGCGGSGTWCFGIPRPDREGFIRFLAEDEGLKDSRDKMGAWIDSQKPFCPQSPFLIIGPYRPDHPDPFITLSFIVNADQLSLLTIAVHYHAHPHDPPPLTAPFGSGCMQILSLAAQPVHPSAVIGATDIAMRQFLPADKLLFTVNPSMAERLARLDKNSFLGKPFHERLKKARRRDKDPL